MDTRKLIWLGLMASLLITPTAWGQPPAVVPVGQPAAPQANLWGFLCMNAEQKAACRKCWCESPLGQLTAGAAGPMSAMSGGLIVNRCELAAIANDIAGKPADSSEGAAARIKKDEEDAKARRLAVRYLGTVDCSRWPEAEAALIKGLRGDRNECVRFEAALALRSGCCCTKKVRKALETCYTGKSDDDFPVERSERVRAAALEALLHCPPEEETTPGNGGTIKKAGVTPGQQYNRVVQEQVVPNTRGILVLMAQSARAQTAVASTSNLAAAPPIQQRSGSLSGIVASAFTPRQEYVVPVAPISVPFATNITPREIRPIAVQPMPIPPVSQPREATGWVTIELAPPTAPLPVLSRP